MIPGVRARRRTNAAQSTWRRLCPKCAARPAVLALSLGCASQGGVTGFPEPDPDLAAANLALGDPHKGRFPLAEALAGLPEAGSLVADLVTSEGTVRCRLMPEHAPLTVASFVGLARGLRPFRDEDKTWRSAPYYEGIPWHRAESGQFVQTGRRGRLAQGGFFLQDELGYGDSFDRPGVLAMANTGSEHSASVQFFVTTAPAPHLEGLHTIFGACDGEAALRRIARQIEAHAEPPPTLVRIDISRQ